MMLQHIAQTAAWGDTQKIYIYTFRQAVKDQYLY